MIWYPNFNLGRLIYFLLLVDQDFNLGSPLQSVLTQSRGDFTIVFWPDNRGTQSRRQASRRTSTGWRSTWWYHLWKLWRMSATPGHNGVEDGLEPMLFTLNSPAPQNGHDRKGPPRTEN